MSFKVKKRRKSSRYLGGGTAQRGAKERTRGSGNRGGKGMAGTGKRADQRKSLIINLYGNKYFGKSKTLRRGHVQPKLEVINLNDIQQKYDISKEINLSGFKILGEGEVKSKLNIKASAASNSAIENVKAAGGSITLQESEESEESESEETEQ